MSDTNTIETKLEALDQVNRDLLSEHYHRVRTAKKYRGQCRSYTAVVRIDSDGEPYVSSVFEVQQSEHVKLGGDNALIKIRMRGYPLMEGSLYSTRLANQVRKRQRKLKQQLEMAQSDYQSL